MSLRRAKLLFGTALVALAAVAPQAGAAGAPPDQPWRLADAINSALFEAQTAQALGEDDEAEARADAARAAFAGSLARQLDSVAPQAAAAIRAGLADATRAAASGDDVELSAARGKVRAAIYECAYEAALDAASAGRAEQAAAWLMVREFRTATKFTRPGADATLAVEALGAGSASAESARLAIAKDLLDAYQSRLREIVADAVAADADGFAAKRAERAALAAGIWKVLASRYGEEFDDAQTAAAGRAWAALGAAGVAATPADREFEGAARRALDSLHGFTAAPFTPEEEARYAIQLLRFVDLIPFEWGKGVDDGVVKVPFEVQEAKSFRDGAETAFADLEGELEHRDPAATARVAAILDELETDVGRATDGEEGLPSKDQIEQLTDEATSLLEATYPAAWKGDSVESDFDLVTLTLDRMDTAIRAGQYEQAEQARLAAYAFFEFGPELRLRSLDPGLSAEIEGLVWFGSGDFHDGLAELIADEEPSTETRPVRVELDERLEDAKATLGDGASRTTVVTNAALVVFREGLEAVLILAAVMAGLTGARARLRRPIYVGVAVAFVASIATYFVANELLESFSQYGEKLEAVVGLIAIGVLLIVLNWFLHKVYWTSWISGFNARRKELLQASAAGFLSGQVVGFALLGFSMTYREGFETVLFLQAMGLNAGVTAVLEGALIGLALVFAVGFATFKLESKLPYKRMLIITGILIGVVLVILVGNTARTMQGVGWLPITPIDIDLPYWMGLWFGVYPTVETIGLQIVAAAFVIGSYYAAEWYRKRDLRRAIRESDAQVPAPAAALNGSNGHAPGQASVNGAPVNGNGAALPATTAPDDESIPALAGSRPEGAGANRD